MWIIYKNYLVIPGVEEETSSDYFFGCYFNNSNILFLEFDADIFDDNFDDNSNENSDDDSDKPMEDYGYEYNVANLEDDIYNDYDDLMTDDQLIEKARISKCTLSGSNKFFTLRFGFVIIFLAPGCRKHTLGSVFVPTHP